MATIPTIPSFTVGQILGAASLQQLSTASSFMLTRAGGFFQAHQTVAQSIPIATDTALTFPAEDYDTDGGHSVSSNTSRYTAQTAGVYKVWGAYHSLSANTDYGAFIRVNGTSGAYSYSRAAKPASGDCYLPVAPVEIGLAVGDFVEICVRQTSTGALNTSTSNGGSLFCVEFSRP
jgi:hypothetical protein